MAGITLTIQDGNGALRDIGAYADAQGNLVTGSVPLVGGAPLSESNRLPASLPPGGATAAKQDATIAGLGAPDDVAWQGLGSTGLVGILKGVYTLLKGTLVTSLTQNGAALSSGNPLPVSLPASAATASGQAVSNAALGAPDDAAWVSGSGSAIALLKRLAALLTGTLTVKGAAVLTTLVARDITTTSSSVLAANASRRFLMVLNQGTGDVWLGHGTAAAVAGSGQLLPAGGGFVFDGVAVPSIAMTAVTASGTSKLIVQEG